MKSISSRITLFYALTVTATLACLCVTGHVFLENYLIHQLDELKEAHFRQLKAILGPNYETLTPGVIDQRIRESTESASSLFYIDMHVAMTNRFFRSNNLKGQSIPDIPGERAYMAEVPGIGELRVTEFRLPPFDVTIAAPMAPIREVMNGYREIFFALLLLTLVVSAAIGYGLSQLILKPVRVIQATANRIRSDNLNERIPVGDVKDELSKLARFLNQMFDRLEASFSQIRRFSAEASHELKTPLSLVRLHAERLLVTGDLEASQREAVHVQLEELARVNQIIDELLFLSRADARAINLALTAQEPIAFLSTFAQDASALAEYHGHRLRWHHQGEGTVAFEANRIRQVLLNLIVNAINAMSTGGDIRLDSELSESSWHLSIEDDGPGLTTEQRDKIFDRFVRFNTASGDKGSGLGLAISRSIVKLHRGTIVALAGNSGRGLRMVIELPRT
jgi:signal transduction histidine kinase